MHTKIIASVTFVFGVFCIPTAAVLAVDATSPWEIDGRMLNDDTVENIEVMKIADGAYRMIYSQNGSVYRTDSDDGFAWDTDNGTLLVAGAGQISLVKISAGNWRMYFTRFSEAGNSLYSAVSTDDGETFTEEEGMRLTPGHPDGHDAQSGIVHPSVIKLNNGKYRVYYDTLYTQGDEETPWKILSATSEDGLAFTHDNGVRVKPKDLPGNGDCDAVWSPHITKRNGKYRLYVTAQYSDKPLTRNGIYLATSKNGRQFTVHEAPLVYRDRSLGNAQNTDGGMNGAPQDPFVLRRNNSYWLYFWITEKGLFRAERPL